MKPLKNLSFDAQSGVFFCEWQPDNKKRKKYSPQLIRKIKFKENPIDVNDSTEFFNFKARFLVFPKVRKGNPSFEAIHLSIDSFIASEAKSSAASVATIAKNFLRRLETEVFPSPRLTHTKRNSVQLDYTFEDGSYFEIEIYKKLFVIIYVSPDLKLIKGEETDDANTVFEILHGIKVDNVYAKRVTDSSSKEAKIEASTTTGSGKTVPKYLKVQAV